MSLQGIFCFVAACAALGLSGLAVALDRRTPLWRLFALGMLLLAVETFCAGMAAVALLPEHAMGWQSARLLSSTLLPVTWALFSLLYAEGGGRGIWRRWLAVLVAFVVLPAAAAAWRQEFVTGVLAPGPGQTAWAVRLGLSGKALQVMLLLTSVFVLMNLERVFRSAVGTIRWRVKFMVLGIGTVFAVRIHTSAQALLYSHVSSASDVLGSAALLLGGLLMTRGFLRNRTQRAGIYVSHAVLHGSATVLLSGVYLLLVGVLAGFFRQLGGGIDFPLLALVVFTGVIGLGVLLASDRLRLYTKRMVSRHFRRPQYDYRGLWTRFAEATAGLTEREAYCRAVVRIVSETFEALSVTIWLTGPAHDRLAFSASTALAAGAETAHTPPSDSRDGAWCDAALRALRDAHSPLDIETSSEPWAVALRESNPSSFRDKGGRRVVVPLTGQEALTGIMVIGDRVVGVPFSPEELDLLGVIGNEVGAHLLNLDLSERLLQAREMEAFQTMSAFFVHDLKNTASTLSLMLENLPKHFADPAFRTDALKAIARSVGRIENLIQRLTMLRHKLDINPVEADLNALVRHTLDGLGDAVGAALTVELGSAPRVKLDPEQIEKVLTNLVLNASEATGQQGRLCIRTQADEAGAVLTVSDNGCGMSRRFMKESLFHPFRSTKKDGMGIGLFQSRMIVEAHGGRIDVESEEGHGTTFSVRLPTEGGKR